MTFTSKRFLSTLSELITAGNFHRAEALAHAQTAPRARRTRYSQFIFLTDEKSPATQGRRAPKMRINSHDLFGLFFFHCGEVRKIAYYIIYVGIFYKIFLIKSREYSRIKLKSLYVDRNKGIRVR